MRLQDVTEDTQHKDAAPARDGGFRRLFELKHGRDGLEECQSERYVMHLTPDGGRRLHLELEHGKERRTGRPSILRG